jgi:hypothetical protein
MTYCTSGIGGFSDHNNNLYISVLIEPIVVFLISSQTKISSRCQFDIYLMSIFILPYFDVLKLKIEVKKVIK